MHGRSRTWVLRAESRDSSEVTVSPGEITFTPGDWSVPQFLTVQGVDDPVLDGTQVTTLLLVVDSTASDPAFIAAGLDSVLVATGDNDRASFFLLPDTPAWTVGRQHPGLREWGPGLCRRGARGAAP